MVFLKCESERSCDFQNVKMNWLFWCQFHQRFYVQIFCTNVASAAFFSYILALAKNSNKKCAQKTLMKLTAGCGHLKRQITTLWRAFEGLKIGLCVPLTVSNIRLKSSLK